ncbi:uncharacterized protein LOC112553221 [Pomacea canaliculata]|uniref:uncharacterized protein LOC112553221 n=1 Tax=Pomacea canaliculata TaxID=400727 RepID=UPI000D72E32B|nr:uncharacterized protein LOC112553221 [Pomacea canaliculata]
MLGFQLWSTNRDDHFGRVQQRLKMSRKSESDLHRVEDRDVEDLPGEDFHRKLFESLDAACKETGQIIHDVHKDKHFAADYELVMPRVQQAALRCTATMEKAESLCRAMEHRIVALHAESQELEAREELLRQEQDAVSTRGHELYWRGNCREMERNLGESFIARERCLSVEGARSFRDEVSEKLLRTADLLRVAELRTCSLDSQLHATMKLMGQTLEKWRMARGEWVDALDNLTQLQRDKILEWLTSSEPRSEAQQQLGEQTVDYLYLLQQERHLAGSGVAERAGHVHFQRLPRLRSRLQPQAAEAV